MKNQDKKCILLLPPVVRGLRQSGSWLFLVVQWLFFELSATLTQAFIRTQTGGTHYTDVEFIVSVMRPRVDGPMRYIVRSHGGCASIPFLKLLERSIPWSPPRVLGYLWAVASRKRRRDTSIIQPSEALHKAHQSARHKQSNALVNGRYTVAYEVLMKTTIRLSKKVSIRRN
jgi:hypothetical protein